MKNGYKSIKPWFHGEDGYCKIVKYEKAVEDKAKTAGLAAFVESEAEAILIHLREFADRELRMGSDYTRDFDLPTIYLDDSCPMDSCGTLSLEDVVEKIALRTDLEKGSILAESITAILMDKDLSNKKKVDLIGAIISRVEYVLSFYKYKEYIKDLKDILKDEKKEYKRLGEYVNEHIDWNTDKVVDKKIVIYYYNHDRKNKGEYLASISHTLAHEIFHAFHDYISQEFFNKENGYEARAIKEALADFYSNMYCVADSYSRTIKLDELKKKSAEARYNSWKNSFNTSWIYYHAIHFMKIQQLMPFSTEYEDYWDNGCFEKMSRIFIETKYNPKDVEYIYKMLVR